MSSFAVPVKGVTRAHFLVVDFPHEDLNSNTTKLFVVFFCCKRNLPAVVEG